MLKIKPDVYGVTTSKFNVIVIFKEAFEMRDSKSKV